MTIEDMRIQSELLHNNQHKTVKVNASSNERVSSLTPTAQTSWWFAALISMPFIVGGLNWKTMTCSLALFAGVPMIHYHLNVKQKKHSITNL
jgi:hypothetical protein